jgi:flavin reductase (NADH)/flavin reductase
MCSSNAVTEGRDQVADSIPSAEPDRFLGAMCYLASGYSIVAAADGPERSGLTVTAVRSVTADPPRLLVCIAREVRAYALIVESGALAAVEQGGYPEALARVASCWRTRTSRSRSRGCRSPTS